MGVFFSNATSLSCFRNAQDDATDQRPASSSDSHPKEPSREGAGELHRPGGKDRRQVGGTENSSRKLRRSDLRVSKDHTLTSSPICFVFFRGAEYVSAREWMRICFELLELLKAHKKAIRRATVNTFGYIAKAIG